MESGEFVQSAAIAGHYGVPPIMVTGDEATCREAQKFFGEHCVTVAVKQGLAREAADALSLRGNPQGALRRGEAGGGGHPQVQTLHPEAAHPGKEAIPCFRGR